MSPMNNRLLVPQKLPLLLDYAPGAAAAYSLRSLSNSYVGPVVTVRRSTDSAEADFTSTEVSDGTLAAWCGGGDGFVKQWWSQAGSNHATQSTAGYQPQIVDSGVVTLDGGKPAVRFDGVDDYFAVPSGMAITSNVARSMFFIQSPTATTSSNTLLSIGGPIAGSGTLWDVTPEYAVRVSGGNSVFGGAAVGTMGLLAITFSGTSTVDIRCHLNGALRIPSGTNTTINTSNDASYIGASTQTSPTPTNFFDGTISELIIYPTDMTSLRERIEADMAWYY